MPNYNDSQNERDPAGARADCQRHAEQMVSLAKRAGADGAEVLVRDGNELEVKVRLGQPELVKQAGSRALGLRVVKDNRVANTYTSDFSAGALEQLAADTVELAELAEPDEYAALPAPEKMAQSIPELKLFDEATARLGVDEALALALRAESAANKCDPRITNSDGASFGRVSGASAFASSAGFSGSYSGSFASLVVQPVADDEGGKKRNGFWWSASRFASELDDPESVGQEAARRTVAKLGSRKIATCEAPVIFPPETARALLGKLAGVASGGAVWRKSSYLANRENTVVASPLVTIVDDPLILGAPGSRPYDGEGLLSQRNTLVEEGVLKMFLCDTYAARKLGRDSTASAGRGVGGGAHVSTSNLILLPGKTSREAVMNVDRGFLVTSLMGFGFNAVTGDFSQGAEGFWVEKGEQVFPVSEVTISLGFDDLWRSVEAVGDDLDARSSTQAPSLRVSSMTIAGA